MPEQIYTQQLMKDPLLEQVGMSWWKLQPMESPCRIRLLAGAVACGEKPIQEQSVKDCTPWQRTCAGTVPVELQPVRRTRVGEVYERLYCMRRTPGLSRGNSEEEGVAERSWYRQTAALVPDFPALLGGEVVEELGAKK
ncbi:hypothetical protein AV530_012697 [Patagioenas fasciata monilis]|uniref:Uncharacterized protein n=1 Tax=Patagioenas fasciata monilis TaxID=372326 RepID=A0A1V4JD73_PATFA|nr:hypothetical protein AV530_012697 [Patagioenas fasciata monilis]